MDTYTVTFTNGNTTTFTVTNGEKGDKGDKGDKGNTGNTGATGNGISTVAKTGTSGLVDTYTITFTNGTTTTFTVTNGADGTVPIVTSWESTLSDSKVASEKLTKNALDGKQATLVSGTNIKTINNESLLGNGNITVAPQIDIQTSWGNPTSDSKVASEKLTKDTLDTKIAKSSTSGLVKNDGTIDTSAYITSSALPTIQTSWGSTTSDSKVASEKLIKSSLDGKLDNAISSTAVSIASNDDILITDYSDSNKIKRVANILASQVKDGTAHSNIGSSANDTQATINSDIDTALSNKVSKSSTSGLIKNDGSIDTNTYLSSSALDNYVQKNILSNGANLNDINVTGFYYCSYNVTGTTISNTPNNVQSAFCLLVEDLGENVSTKKKQTFTTTSDGNTWIRTKTGGSWQSWKQLSTFSGSYDDLSNKPSIPSSSSDLSDGSNLVKKSSKTGLIKNDGSIDTSTYLTSSALTDYVQKSNASGLLRNDGSVDASNYITSSALTNYVQKSSTTGLLKNDGSVDTNSYLTTGSASSTYQTKLVSGTSIKTINNESLLGSGNISIGGSSVDIVTSWESTPSDSKVASEKLVKDTIDDIKDLIGDAITYINQ